ncbi:MAG: preprotein translocase subunit YajC [Spirochaetales bacterium]
MNNLFSDVNLLMAAPAGGEAAPAGSMLTTIVMFGLIFVIFYFLIIRPQNKKQKETKKMLEALKKGDKVVSIGGIHGSIQSIKDDTVVLKIDSDTKMTLSRSAISNVVEASKGGKKAEKQVEEVSSDDESEDDSEE